MPGIAVALAAVLLGALVRPVGAAASVGAAALLAPETDRWIQVQTAHFTLYSNASERRTLDLGKRLERFRAVLSRFNKKFKVDPPVTTSIYVFKDDASLTPYKKRFNGKPVELSGLFVGHPDGYYILLNGARQGDPLEVIYHEYTHHFLENNLHKVPAWFNEGLAECYSAFRADDKNASIGLTQDDHVLYLREHDLMPLHDLFAITTNSPDYNEGERRGVFYAESWALMHYLMWDKPERKPQFLRFLEALSRGETPDTAFPASFETSYQTLENELRLYVRQARFMFTVYKLSDLGLDETVKVAPMKREETLFRLGDLLAHIDEDRGAEAETLFHEAQRLAPGYPAAYAGLAYLAQIAGRFDDAVGLYDKAASLDPNDPLTCFHLGQCLVRRASTSSSPEGKGDVPPDLVRAEDMFGQTIRMRPGFAEAYVEYARAIMQQAGGGKAAIPLLEAARILQPSRIDVVVNLAILYARTGDDARARDLVENVLARMGDREALEQARSLLQIEADRHATGQPAAPRESAAARQAGAGQAGGQQAGAEGRGKPPDVAPPAETRFPPFGTTTGDGADPVAIRNRQVSVYNQAVARANQRDYKGAIEILEKLLKEVKDEDLRDRITGLLNLLRRDAARMQNQGG